MHCNVGSDDFADGVIGTQWYQWGPALSETGGQLVITPSGATAEYSGLTSVKVGDLRECSVTMEVTGVLSSLQATSVYLLVMPEPKNAAEYVQVQWVSGNFEAVTPGGLKKVPYDPVAHRWWRIGSSGGTTRIYTSPDAKTWTEHISTPTPTSYQIGRAEFGAGTWEAQAANIGSAVFATFNQ